MIDGIRWTRFTIRIIFRVFVILSREVLQGQSSQEKIKTRRSRVSRIWTCSYEATTRAANYYIRTFRHVGENSSPLCLLQLPCRGNRKRMQSSSLTLNSCFNLIKMQILVRTWNIHAVRNSYDPATWNGIEFACTMALCSKQY